MVETGRYLLLVEDNEDDILLTRMALEQNRIRNELRIARDGAEAVAALLGADATGELPVVVLLDLKLPKLDGFEVLRRIRADPRARMLPVVILTSSREERDVVEGYDLGANSYVHKPIEFSEFASAVRELGLYWVVLNEPPPNAPP